MLLGSFSICFFFSSMRASASSPVTTALFAWSSFFACSLLARMDWKPPFLPTESDQPLDMVVCASAFLRSWRMRWSPGLSFASLSYASRAFA